MTHLSWPALPYDAWKDTYETLHMWTQIVGKIRLARMPWLTHTWQVAFYPTASGLTTQEPKGFGDKTVQPSSARYDPTLREFITTSAQRAPA